MRPPQTMLLRVALERRTTITVQHSANQHGRGSCVTVRTPNFQQPLTIGLPHQYEWMRTVLTMIFVMSTFDGVLTIFWVMSGQAIEANPLWAELLRIGPFVFMLAKTALVAAGVYLLWRYRLLAVSVLATFALFLVYYALIVYHLSFGLA